ncbi:MAG: reductase [Frankiales bacterium]|jgi:FMN reductase|nr:reductase [Frankiales bacterium]
MNAVVVVGNPKPASRTAAVGVSVAEAVLTGSGVTSPAVQVIELSSLAPSLFSWGDPDVAAAKATVLEADLLVIASPVYKASYTGLLKAFLDQFGRDELAALATVPVMVGAAPAHALAVETQLRPVLIEIGASCPTRGLYVLEKVAEDSAGAIEEWLAVWGDALVAVMQAGKAIRGYDEGDETT